MIKDDELIIPIQVVNNRNFDQNIQVSIIETLFPSTILNKVTNTYIVASNQIKIVEYQLKAN